MRKYLMFTAVLMLVVVVFISGCNSAQPETSILEDDHPHTDGTPNDHPHDDAMMEDESMMTAQGEVKSFNVVAKKWEFAPATIEVNQGDTVKLEIKSIDVAHGIAIPDFRVSSRLDPGKTINLEFIADKKGTFTFFCNVQCGQGHGGMRGTLIVS